MLRRWWQRIVRGPQMAANGEERRNNQNSWAWPSIFLTHDFRKAQMTHLLDLALKPSEHRAGRLAALDEAKINAYASAKELHQDACDLLWEQYGKPLMKYAPPAHQAWWKQQVRNMLENAMRSAWPQEGGN